MGGVLIVTWQGGGATHALRRVLGALNGLGTRVLVLTGLELGPAEVPAGPGVCAESYVPHAAVVPHASVVVTHAGMGTLLEAFRAGVPCGGAPAAADEVEQAAQCGAARPSAELVTRR